MTKTTELPVASSLAGADEMVVNQGGATKRAVLSLAPVSTPQASALALKANAASPSFTGPATFAGDVLLASGQKIQFDNGVSTNYSIGKVGTTMTYLAVLSHNFNTPVATTGMILGGATLGSNYLVAPNGVSIDSAGRFDAASIVSAGNVRIGATGSLLINGRASIASPSTTSLQFSDNGSNSFTITIGASNLATFNGGVVATYLKPTVYTFATLPSAAAVGAGARAHISDCNSTTFNGAAASGGANSVPVFVDGASTWKVG